jgi:O-antigen ligase/tetratricopeptide (TPR) repeat protein
MEALLLVMLCLSPWAYGAVHPGFEFLLYAGLGALLVLWAVRMLLEGRVSWTRCPVTWCLAALFLVGMWQLTPLSTPLLRSLSPSTVDLCARLLPDQREMLRSGQPPEPAATAGSMISLCPGATRKEMIRLLAVLLVFVVVRNNIASVSSARRLAVAAVANGALLSLFALMQFFSSPHNTLYWTYPSLGNVFGPFICRNHFPYYINLCVGLGVGLLIGQRRRSIAWWRSARRLLREPRNLWIGSALALMLTATAVSLSRGGLLALAGGAAVCVLLKLAQPGRSLRLGSLLVILAGAVGMALWFGTDAIETRLATLTEGKAFQESRLPLWSRVLPAVEAFPLWGTGFGTFRYLEPLYRTSGADAGLVFDHAHNDYLEFLIEGGIPGLALCLAAIALVYWYGCRALTARRDEAGRGLALGALLGLTTLVIHSLGDFGTHVPAITLLATVVAAQLCGLGSNLASAGEAWSPAALASAGSQQSFRLGGIAPVLGAATCLGLGLVLVAAGWRAHCADRLQAAALLGRRGDTYDLEERQFGLLHAAARFLPEDAETHLQLASAHSASYETQIAVWSVAGRMPPSGAPAPSLGLPLASAAVAASARAEQDFLVHRHLLPALRHYLEARDQCPLLCGPHLALATYRTWLKHADPRAAYIERATFLAPGLPEVWYSCGLLELMDNRPDQAWKCWRHCLELSDRYLSDIVKRSPSDALAITVLPDRPDILLNAASHFDGRPAQAATREALLQRALALLEGACDPAPESLSLRARVYQALDREAEALAAYRTLLAGAPRHVKYRQQFALFLYSRGRLREAHEELLVILAIQPGNNQARELLAMIAQRLAAGSRN